MSLSNFIAVPDWSDALTVLFRPIEAYAIVAVPRTVATVKPTTNASFALFLIMDLFTLLLPPHHGGSGPGLGLRTIDAEMERSVALHPVPETARCRLVMVSRFSELYRPAIWARACGAAVEMQLGCAFCSNLNPPWGIERYMVGPDESDSFQRPWRELVVT
jgi:hypothetical protein